MEPTRSLQLSKSITKLLDSEFTTKSASLAVALSMTRSKSVRPEGVQTKGTNSTKTEMSSGSVWKTLSPSMYALLFVATLDAVCFEMHNIVYPVVFEMDFGISATVSGYLNAVSNVVSYLLISVIMKYANRFNPFRYPFSLLTGIVCIFTLALY